MSDQMSVKFVQSLGVDTVLLQYLQSLDFSANGTRRVCLHKSETSLLHAMLVESCEAEYPRHYHSDGDEVTVGIKGQVEVVIWENGLDSVPTRLVLGLDSANTRAVFIPRNVPHTTRSLNGSAIYLEIKLGPFNKNALVQI